MPVLGQDKLSRADRKKTRVESQWMKSNIQRWFVSERSEMEWNGGESNS